MAEVGGIEQYIQLGRLYLREGKAEEAYQSFCQAFERLKGRPVDEIPSDLLSYYGLALALVKGEHQEALRLCRIAMATENPKADFYLNLGKVYLLSGGKTKAIRAFNQGLRVEPRHTGILVELKRLGRRRRPLLSLFSRNHFLNRYLGVFIRKARTNSR